MFDDDEAWWTHHLDQLAADSREAQRKAIRYHVWAHRVYAAVILFQTGVAILVLIGGRIPYITLASMTFTAVLWWFSVRRLERIRNRES